MGEREREREKETVVRESVAWMWGLQGCGTVGRGGGWVAACAACVLLGISQCASITVHQM